jgi:hypothetical protein
VCLHRLAFQVPSPPCLWRQPDRPDGFITVIASGDLRIGADGVQEIVQDPYGLYAFAFVLARSSPGSVGTEAAHCDSEILDRMGLLVVPTTSSGLFRHLKHEKV